MRKERTLLSNVSLQVPPTSSAHDGKSLGIIDNEADVSMSKSRKDAINHTQIIIVTTKRSGSSFVGELFNVNPNVFYVFEPLSMLTRDMMKRRFPKNEIPQSSQQYLEPYSALRLLNGLSTIKLVAQTRVTAASILAEASKQLELLSFYANRIMYPYTKLDL